MTVTATPRIAGPFATNGAQTTFAFAFKVFSDDDVAVILTEEGAALDTGTTLGVADYSVALNADQDVSPGGTVTTTTAYDSGNEITITSALALEMQTVFSNQGGFYPRVLNDVHDRIVMMIQQIASGVLIGLQGPPGPPGEPGGGGGASTTEELTHAPYSNSLLIGSIAGNVLTVNAASMAGLTPLGASGLPEVEQKLSRLLGGLPDDIEIVAETTPLIIPTQNGVYTLSEAVSPALPGVNYFLANKRLTEEERPLAKVYSDKQSVADWGTTGQNDSGDEAKLIKAFAEKRIGSDIFIPAGDYTLTDTLLHQRDGNIIMEHGTRLNLRVAAGNLKSALKVDHRYSRVATESRGQGIYAHGGGINIYNTSSGGSADLYDSTGNRYDVKAGGYALEINTNTAGTQQVIRYTVDGLSLRGGVGGAMYLKGGDPNVNAFPEVYWIKVENCPSIEGAIVDNGSDGIAYMHNNFIGSYQPAMIWNKVQGAFNNLARNNTSSCRRGFITVQNGSMFTIQENQIELAGVLDNDSAYKAQIEISATDYPCFLPRIVGNNFGTGQRNDVAVALAGEVIGAVFDANYWNMYTYLPDTKYDLVIGPDVRDIVWLPTNQFRGLRIGAAATTVASLAALKATNTGVTQEVNYDNSRWFFFIGDQSAYTPDDVNYVLADGVPITSGLWMRSIIDIGDIRRPRGYVTDPTRLLRVGYTGGASDANIKSHTGLMLPITSQLTMLNGATTASVIEVIRDSTGIWEARGDLATVHATNDVLTLPAWARGPFQQNVRPISNGAVVPRALTTAGVLAGGGAFGSATVSLDGMRWQGLSNYDYDPGP